MPGDERAAAVAATTAVARSLASPDGRNTDYDRALVDLTAALLGLDPAEVADRILAPGSPLRTSLD